jgi:hypothetical protein
MALRPSASHVRSSVRNPGTGTQRDVFHALMT